jgi:hypothetical protein
VLEWIGTILKQNVARTRLQADRRTISSEGFMLNLSAILLDFCVPFLDRTTRKVHTFASPHTPLTTRAYPHYLSPRTVRVDRPFLPCGVLSL